VEINARKVNTGVERQQYQELGPQMNANKRGLFLNNKKIRVYLRKFALAFA